MNGGTISENSVGDSVSYGFGGGVCISGIQAGNSGAFTMNGGTISGNTVKQNGGGVYVYNGTFTMYDGTISGNTANNNGGGVHVHFNTPNNTFTMNGGTISGNTASSNGGGVYTEAAANAIFKKNSGIIYGSAVGNDANGVPLKNTAGTSGDAVFRSSSRYRNTTAGQTDQIDSTTGKGLSANGNAPYLP